MMNTRRRPGYGALVLVLLLVPVLVAGCRPPRPGGPGGGHGPTVRLNEVQVLASHNSYHLEPEPTLFAALRSFLGAAADGFQYTHRPLAEQLDAGVRAVELDVFADDPAGGRYAAPALVPVLGLAPVDPAFAEPGLKVFHVQEVDYRSTCTQLTDCLGQIRTWSDAHPGHLPITVQIEAKDGTIADPGLGFVTPLPWSQATFAQLEAEIRSVLSEDRILSPADVRGRKPTLRDAVLAGRWPRLDAARGQVLFVLDDKGAKRDAYRAEVPDLADRLIFVDVPEDDPDAGITVVNDPIGDADRIRALVAAGFIVRTRADADTVEARSGATTRRDAALASGAQYVSTDYVWPDDRFGTGYAVDLPGDTAARCNPVSAPRRCERANLGG
jgi:Phosphoinositide phospholipase C, Ca2+-dependent